MDNTDKKFIQCGSGIAILMMLGLIHFVNWGPDSLAIIPLKIKSISGIASAETYHRLGKICETRYKYSCVAQAYEAISEINPHDTEIKLTLADLQRHLGNHSKALRAYDDYIKAGGNELAKAHYGRGKSLAAIGDMDHAFLAFDKAILAKPEVIQTTVTEAYLDLLIQNSRYKKAKAVIAEARRRGRDRDIFAHYSLPQ